MTAFALSLLAQFWPYIVGAFGLLAGIWKVYAMGQAKERNKQAGKDLAATKDRLEMDREATAAERAATGMTDDQARKEAEPWVKR